MADEKCIISPERDYIGKSEVLKLKMRIENLEHWQESSKIFHENFYNWQREQIAREARLDEQLKVMGANIEKVVAFQECQKEKPSKRIDAIIDKALWLVIGSVITFMLTRVGF